MAMVKINEYQQTLMELGDKPYSYHWSSDRVADFFTDTDIPVKVVFNGSMFDVDISFKVDHSFHRERVRELKQQEQFRMMGTIVHIIAEYVVKNEPERLKFSAYPHSDEDYDGSGKNPRARLYGAYLKRLAKKYGYEYSVIPNYGYSGNGTLFKLQKIERSVPVETP